MSNQKGVKICENCCYVPNNRHEHYWWCKKRPTNDLLEDIARKIDRIAEHFN